MLSHTGFGDFYINCIFLEIVLVGKSKHFSSFFLLSDFSVKLPHQEIPYSLENIKCFV